MLAQVSSVPRDLEANGRRLVEVLGDHSSADIVVFPELYLSGYQLERLEEIAVTQGGGELRAIAQACAHARTAVVLGFVEVDDGRFFNSVVAIDSTGALRGVYRKVNLFGTEAEAFTSGDGYTTVAIDNVEVGLLNCFDIEFPEPARSLALEGAELLISIAANMDPYYADHELASRARALDNRLPHIYVNAVGEAVGFTFAGGSRVIGPDGQTRGENPHGDSIISVEVRVREQTPPAVDYLRRLRTPAAPQTGSTAT